MWRGRRSGLIGVVLLLVLCAGPVPAAELPASEHTKIEALIQHVATLTEAVFIRNQKGYSATIAAQFLREKWAATFMEITTAQGFITHIASVSSTSGQPYRIRFPDGREIPSGDYLRAVLEQMAP
jgi:hypothetical protein